MQVKYKFAKISHFLGVLLEFRAFFEEIQLFPFWKILNINSYKVSEI